MGILDCLVLEDCVVFCEIVSDRYFEISGEVQKACV